ncbi:phosphatidylinositol kinase- protein kinase tor1 [Rhizoclosmatium sp. JEL0117]|nr:phosphatidylinositol kinase- protein kinase tor1 [Rhizoclosmatium sp. JEL0117]
MKVLLTKAKDPIAGVAVKSIAAIGELSSTDSKDYVLFFDEIIKTIMEALQDQSSLLKRQASLKSLGQVCSNTGVVISPYISYPTLLDILVGILKAEEDSSIRLETMRVLGVLGAVDPYKLKLISEGPTDVHTEIMPEFLAMMKSCSPGTLEFYFTKLADLVSIVGQHIRTYINTILDLIRDFWLPMPNVQYAILSLMESLAVVFGIEFKTYLATLLPLILQVFETDSSETKFVTQKAFHSFYVFGDALHDYLYLVIPAHLKLLDLHNVNIELKRSVIRSLGKLSRRLALNQHGSKIIFSLVRILDDESQVQLREATLETIAFMAFTMKHSFTIFLPQIKQVMSKHNIRYPLLEKISAKIIANETLLIEILPDEEERATEFPYQNNKINQRQLQRAWDTAEKSTREDWVEWMRRLNVELIKESPSHTLRSCASLAAVYNPLARELFNAAFVACWPELLDQFKEDLIQAIEVAIKAPNISPDISQTLLNLAEFMEHDEKPLPIDIRTLSQYAVRCHAYAKALHYKEAEFMLSPSPSAVESLITINNQLEQFDSAIGIVKAYPHIVLGSTWYEKLHRWEDALASYEVKNMEDPKALDALYGRMRCLQNLGEWENLSNLCRETYYSTDDETVKKSMAPIAASAAWSLNQWELMEEYVQKIKADSPDGAFFRSILALHQNRFPDAASFIQKARELLDTELMALVGESYSRAYPVIVRIQMLTELEEVIAYKNFNLSPERQALIRKTWMARLMGCQKTVDIWQKVLRVRALVISPEEGADMWIKFANLCRKNSKMGLSFKTLNNLLTVSSNDLGVLDTSNNPPHVIYACLKHAWASGITEVRENAFDQLRHFTTTLVERLGLSSLESIKGYMEKHKDDVKIQESMKLLARCYVKLGEWQMLLEEELSYDCIPEILQSFTAATYCDSVWYKAWHKWALANVEIVAYHERETGTVSPQVILSHVIPSIKGFFHSVALSKESSLQDALRLTTLWFKYGFSQDVNVSISEGFEMVNIDTWLQVIPQLIARIHVQNPHIRKLLHQLLFNLGRAHPQALVWSLTVASQSQSENRRTAAVGIMDRLKFHCNALVEQVLLVSQELLRVAVLWPEMWFSGIEDASKCYHQLNDVSGMFDVLEPLHRMLEQGPETERESVFYETYYTELRDAWQWCERYKRTKNDKDLRNAWEFYYAIFQKLETQLQHLRKVELASASPRLLAASKLELAIPGTYQSGTEVVKIDYFVPTLVVLTSKQRPRRLTIQGSDGKEYKFLLKGREDLRQDERVMQLFGLVNTLLAADPETFKRHLNIERFSVSPLSPNAGLIGWRPNTDTFNNLISEYRESRKVMLNVEYKLMVQMSANYDTLCLLQKVEVFDYAIGSTTGQDLFKVLWLKSKTAEIWLERRTNYTRSLAVMSMAGYILGLGDRHPSNIMMERNTGKVIHIDFGDCFEVAMQRENYPEKVPFRLTRLFINAMGVSGVEGNFRITSEHVMRVLRENKDSLMAVLEAFVHDPLINWRLLTNPSPIRADQSRTPLSPIKPTIPSFSLRQPISLHNRGYENDQNVGMNAEGLNTRAVTVINRVSNKLTGKDFKTHAPLDVVSQVDRLILQATSSENLCQGWVGWCAFWMVEAQRPETPTAQPANQLQTAKGSQSQPQSVTIEARFQAIRLAKNESERRSFAKDIRDHVSAYAREVSGEPFSKFMQQDVNKRIFELIHSSEVNHKMAGILIIDSLIDFQGEENTIKITRFANYLRIVLPGSDPQISILAAKALGRLAQPGGTLTAEFVEFEVKRALEWLQEGERNESRRYAAVLVLKELSLSSPTLIFSYVPQILDLVWTALRDPKVTIRESGAEVLSACLQLMQQRDSHLRRQWYRKIYDEAERGIQKTLNPDPLHGCLLVYRELFGHAGKFMDAKYNETSEAILRFRDHTNPLIRRTVIQLFPVLASYNTLVFVTNHLNVCVDYLLGELRRERVAGSEVSGDRRAAFLAIGSISLAVQSNILPYLDVIFRVVREFLIRARNRPDAAVSVFQCMSMLAVAVEDQLESRVQGVLNLMFASGLSEQLKQTLCDISEKIPKLLPVIQERFLNMLSMILCGEPYRHPGAPGRLLAASFKDMQTSENKSIDTIILALNCLGSFNFSGLMLQELIRSCAVTYLDDDHPGVRKAAAVTCCQLLACDPVNYQTSNMSMRIVGEVLEKLLVVGITDADPSIRQTVISSLDERFDHHLAQAENIRSIFLAMNDEVFVIRELAITIIGRLTLHNPAYVMPPLRKILIRLLTELQYSNISVQKEESAKLLCDLILASQRLVKPYVNSIMKVLLPKTRDSGSGVSAKSIAAIGELSQVGCEDMLPYFDEIMPIIIETLQDQSSAGKREAALKTLGQLCSNTGTVITPYITYSNLLDILIGVLKSEENATIRLETVKVLGILGALDPYRHKLVSAPESLSAAEMELLPSPSSDDYYPTVVLNALTKILRDNSLGGYHTAVVQAVMYMFETLGLKFVPFLSKIIPSLLGMMRVCPPNMLEFHFTKLADLVMIVKQHIRNYLPDIFSLLHEFWSPLSNLQIMILSLIEAIASALDAEFKTFLPNLLPQILLIFEMDSSERKLSIQKALHAFVTFGATLEEYLYLVIPVIVKLFERQDVPLSIRRYAIKVAGQLSKKMDFADHSAKIIHPLTRILGNPSLKELHTEALNTIVIFARQMKQAFSLFVLPIGQILVKHNISHPTYEAIALKILKKEIIPPELLIDSEDQANKSLEDQPTESTTQRVPVNQPQLKKSWDTSQRSTKEDWAEWMRRFSVELLKESPSHALRSCASLAAVYNPLARDLFNAGFVSCWSELGEGFKDDLVQALETALTAPNISPEITQTLLNLAEFMEHDDKALPIDIRTLGQYAGRCHAWAKALHYKELEFLQDPIPNTVESLISINNQLQQPDSAIGILRAAQESQNIELFPNWYEKLNRWEDALVGYERKQSEDPTSIEALFGRMRCLQNLGEWESLSLISQEHFYSTRDESVRRTMAPVAAAAAWSLGQWGFMQDCVELIKVDSPDGAFFRSILALHEDRFPEAVQFIDKARELLDTELMALVGESYNRAYPVIVRIQMLAELDEIINYKQLYEFPERQALIRKTWMARLKGCQQTVDVWQRILRVRALVISPMEDSEMWIKFANLCRKSSKLSLSFKTLTKLLSVESSDLGILDTSNNPPHVIYACLKHAWASGVREVKDHAFDQLRQFTKTLVDRLGVTSLQDITNQIETQKSDVERQKIIKLLARCYLKLGEWQESLEEGLNDAVIPEILESFRAATHCDKTWYKAWHSWALANFESLSYFERIHEDIQPQVLISHVVPSIQGFFQSVALSKGNSLQDTLRLLTLWFKYGYNIDVNMAISEGFGSVTIDTWLQVIPQLIARIHTPSQHVRRLLHQLLSDVGRSHPQALVWSLTVASKSQSVTRMNAAVSIMDKMRIHSGVLVDQVLLVSQELIRVAILWHEMWHEGLEEASRLYFGEQNIEGMFNTLEPLHQMLERGPETLREISFNQAFGRDLQDALDWCKKYKRTQNVNDLNPAWDLYYHVFRRINKQLPHLTTLELQYVSPKLLAAKNLELAVPGTYKSGEPVVRIESFFPILTVITSKQRPRRLSIKGNNGVEFQYLLKGHEDLRQDERVMQLFGLVNTLLSADAETFKRHLNIEQFSVIPLSPNSGLIGWVPNTDTLHAIIKDFRESRKILLNVEHRLMLQMAPDYDNLTLLQKVEVFEYALANTTGQDLFKVLWLKSKNSEVWLDRRTNYTRSLAVMSMVGYILGLGDRHPSNLMLERFTGKVVHIDFGDCFEVAMHREKFPERIPFRLTRMLVNAMEVSGIEGNFRITCEHVMRVLRENKDSLMAVLEAFVHDPLINWRLLTNPSPTKEIKSPVKQMAFMDLPQDDEMKKYATSKKHHHRTNEVDLPIAEEDVNRPEVLNAKAVTVINRVSNKLTGKDFKNQAPLDVPSQVHRLILQATSMENLCQCYIGWVSRLPHFNSLADGKSCDIM